MEMDPFDEFDMKPITGGLGFHKKTTQLERVMDKVAKGSMGADLPGCSPKNLLDEKNIDEKNGGSAKAFNEMLSSFNQLEKSNTMDKFQKPKNMGRNVPLSSTMAPMVPGAPPLVRPNPVPQGAVQTPVQVTRERKGVVDSPSFGLKEISLSLPSLGLDMMVIMATSLIFLLCFLMVNDVSLSQVISHVQVDFSTQWALGLMFIAVFIIYAVLTRSYFGRTLGEWTFECQLGREQQIRKSYYPLLVLWRSVIVIASLLILPILSLITQRDLTYYLTGLQLYRES